MGKSCKVITTSIYGKYPPSFDFGGKKVLNIGCGTAQYKFPNVINLDAYSICKPDVVHDLEKTPLPFEDNTFDIILANHILEHIHNWWECFNECARVLKPNGVLEVYLPGVGHDSQLGYRDHVSLISHYSFYGIFSLRRPASNAWAKTYSEMPANRLKLVRTGTVLINKWWLRLSPKKLKNFMVEHLRNVSYETQFIFRKVTDEEFQKEEFWNEQ